VLSLSVIRKRGDLMNTVRVPVYVCKRCGHEWIPRTDRKPSTCPKCRSAYWDREIERQTVVDANKKRWQNYNAEK
jgi:predicted Zn-ribbon and HTH transcriptional regulator